MRLKAFCLYAEPHNPVALRVRLSSFIHKHAVVIAQVSMLFRITKLKIPPPHGPQAIFPPLQILYWDLSHMAG